MKKILEIFILTIVSILILPQSISALENKEDLIKKIAPDGVHATFKMKKPTNTDEADFNVNGYVNNLFQVPGYIVIAGCYQEPYTDCTVTIQTEDYQSEWDSTLGQLITIQGWSETYNIQATYDEPIANETVNNYMNQLNDFDKDPTAYYIVEDLSLINYYLTSNKSELWNPNASGRALKYSTINNITKGSNITYYLDTRAGNQDETLMYESAFGPMTIFYNGYAYGTKTEGIYLKRVIYIPQTTEDTKEAYIQAAQKRINNYLGNSSVTISYGGLLSSLKADSEDPNFPITSDGNYYNITIQNRTYKFYIIKGLEEQLTEPTYQGTDIASQIEITSKDSTIPLDTALTVQNITNNAIKDKIGTENYKSYDISLYSESKEKQIEKLENGKFLVKIPIPSELNNKELIVYYITANGTIEEHPVTIKDGYATFETNHFSTYTLAEIPNNTPTINNPNTQDNILTYITTSIICLFGIIGITQYQKNINNHNN